MKLLNTVQYEIIKQNWTRIMAGPVMTWEEFSGETEEEQERFFDWFVRQYNDTFIIPL